jgi:hypothetical protein
LIEMLSMPIASSVSIRWLAVALFVAVSSLGARQHAHDVAAARAARASTRAFEQMRVTAHCHAEDAHAKANKLAADLADLSLRTDNAIDALSATLDDVERARAIAHLDELRSELRARRALIGDFPDARRPRHINTACLDNPLACL